MKVLLIGGNSYIAKKLLASKPSGLAFTPLCRGEGVNDYFDLQPEDFKGYDAVVNFAAIVHRKHPEPEETKRVNTELPVYLARLAKTSGVGQFVQMSTVAVYGSAAVSIDAATPTAPDTAYGRSKLEADRALENMANEHFRVALVRPPMVYGCRAPGNMNALVRLINSGFPLPFAYEGNRRSLLYVGHLATALSRIIDGRHHGTFLLRDAEMPSLQRIASLIAADRCGRSRFFALPEGLVRWLVSFRRLPFRKLYGDLLIDDSESIAVLGPYATLPLETCFKRTLEKGCL
jgi:UDP-glucose 4-epimerase